MTWGLISLSANSRTLYFDLLLVLGKFEVHLTQCMSRAASDAKRRAFLRDVGVLYLSVLIRNSLQDH